MARNNDKYTYRVTWSEDDAEYVGLCAEFPSLSWLAQTPEGALRGIRKVVGEVVVDMLNSGEAFLSPWRQSISAGNSWCAFRRMFTGDWPARS